MARKTDGSWSHDVDRLVELSGRSPVVLIAARLMFPAIPGEVLEHIFSDRKRKREQMRIKVYEQNDCRQCWAVKRHLDRKGASYDVVEPGKVTESDIAAARDIGVQSFPIVVQGDVVFGGFNVDELDRMIERQKEAA